MILDMKKTKSGVSLVTVLLFMLVATIAATATYKWLTSEGRSSASRMMQQEAYQSSMAGIENARTWMTFHANDVGALIKAFIEGESKPINLDGRLRSLQRAGQNYHVWLTGVNTEKSTYKVKILASGESRNGTQHSEVAIFNVDGLYQVKVPQENVFTSVPFEHNYFGGSTQAQGHVKAYSLLINGDLRGSNPVYTDADLVVTGNINITGNSVGAGGTVCVGGNLNADNGVLGGDFYVDENATGFAFPAANEAAGTSSGNVTGNVYINGDLGAPSTGSQKFQKNLTLNGTWTTNLGAHTSSVDGNFCLGENGKVNINSSARTFKVGGNVWAEPDFPIWWNGNSADNHSTYNSIILGNESSSNVYISTAHPSADYVTMRENRSFIESERYYRGTGMQGGYYSLRWDDRTYRPYVAVPSTNDKYYLYKYTGAGQDVDFVVNSSSWGGMGGGMWGGWYDNKIYYANYYVANEVFYTPATGFGWGGGTAEQINYLNYSGNKATGTPYCKTVSNYDKWHPECHVTPWFKSNGKVSSVFPATREFACAESVKAHCDSIWEKKAGCDGSKYKVDDILTTAYEKFVAYANKGCSVTEWNNNLSNALNACYATNSADPTKATENLYNGYQVVKVRDAGKSDPTTALKGKFIIIVENQMGQQSLPPTTSDSYVMLYLTQGASSTIQPALNSGTYNYFIYTKHDISGFMFNNAVFNGSIYATAATCAKVGDFKTRSMTYNEALLTDLASNGVICEASAGSACGGAMTGSSTSGSASSGAASSTGFDLYYISMAPQLGIRLESQYKADEDLPDGDDLTTLNPSFIVLPRIIYLPSDPYGKLTNYYNIQALNGSNLKKADVSVTCSGPGSLPTTGPLYSTTLLSQGIYTCAAAANGYSNNPFWVIVGSDTRGTPQVSFIEPNYEMGASETKEVQISVPAHSADLEINVFCPDVDNAAWSYASLGEGVTREGTSCKMTVAAGGASVLTFATIKTEEAISGTLTLQLLAGEGYIPGQYSSTELYISSSAVLNRADVTTDDITAYCNDNPDVCPEDKSNWPDCSTDETWIEPVGTSYSQLIKNESWSIMVGNTENVTLKKPDDFDDCIVIVPTSDNAIAANAVEANKTYTLRASAKAKTHSLKVGFTGDAGDGKNPIIVVTTETRETQCNYNDAVQNDELSAKTCTVAIFEGETVTLSINDTDDADNFSYWECSGESCPTEDPVTSMTFNSFSVTENSTAVIAHFGEADKHCFFDEFKRTSVECGDETKYCIDNCGNDASSICVGVIDANGSFDNAKWHLISGEISQIEVGTSGEIHIARSVNKGKKESERTSVKVLSTVNAGILGTLKALVNVPRVNSSYGRSAANIRNSGFMLRSNVYGNDFFMLNLYENTNGQLEAQLWRGDVSLSAILSDGTSFADISNSSMVMASVTLTAEGIVSIRAFVGGYYSDNPTEYGATFNLADYNSTLADVAHEFVGFSMADPNFKLYGIGWQSQTYNSECHDTYPTVKCSFAAVATDGVIKTDTLVQPWIGHSGWFDSKSCSPVYYYYNGTDAYATCTSGPEATCSGGYKFDKSGAGAHGYTENSTEMKTAKAWLGNCLNTDETSVIWGVAAEQERAHCGPFWTGEFKECTAHQNLFSGSQTADYRSETTITLDSKQNLRAATLHITLENPDNNEVEIWLTSESDNWGDSDHESHSVKMTGNMGTFEVMQEFASGSNGFDPENVKQIVVKNHGTTGIAVTEITSTCANAIGITNCRAEFDGSQWNVMTQVTNKNLIKSFNVLAKVDDTEHLNVTSDDDGILWNSDIAYTQITDNPYEYQGKSYKFTSTITGTAEQTVSKECSVSPDPIGTVGVDCSVIGTVASGANFPTFNVNFSGCPAAGCSYEIYLDDESTPFATGTEQNGARHSPGISEDCTESAGCTHTYTVKSADGAAASFDDCSASFKVVRDPNNVPPTVQCGVSNNQWNFSTGNLYTTDNLYFLARNAESVEKTFDVQLFKDSEQIGTGTLPQWSQMTSVKNLGTLAAGTYNYKLYAKGELVCDETITVSSTSATCSITGNLQGQTLTLNVSGLSYLSGNTNMTWTVNSQDKTIECNKDGCWNNTTTAPTETGTYPYTLVLGGNTLCSGTFDIDPVLTCSVTPTTLNKGETYTYKATNAVNCWSCTYTYDAGTEGNHNPTDEITKTATTGGTKTLTLSCTCNNNVTGTCSQNITINQPAPSFSCETNKTAQVSSSVALSPVGLTGCEDGCSYTIEGTSVTGSGYTGGALPTFTGPSTTGSVTYAVSLTNSTGTTTKNCSVEFTEEASGDESSGKICLAGGSVEETIPAGTYDFAAICGAKGWWYTCTNGYSISFGSTSYACKGTEVSSWETNGVSNMTMTAPSNGTVTIPTGATITKIGCSGVNGQVPDGCTGTNFTSGSSTESSSSDAGTSSASGDAISVTITYQNYKTFTPGNSYTLTFSGSSGSVFRCTYTDRSYSFKMGVYDSSDWNVGANTGGQATQANPGNGAVKTFVVDSSAPTDLKCATDW